MYRIAYRLTGVRHIQGVAGNNCPTVKRTMPMDLYSEPESFTSVRAAVVHGRGALCVICTRAAAKIANAEDGLDQRFLFQPCARSEGTGIMRGFEVRFCEDFIGWWPSAQSAVNGAMKWKREFFG